MRTRRTIASVGRVRLQRSFRKKEIRIRYSVRNGSCGAMSWSLRLPSLWFRRESLIHTHAFNDMIVLVSDMPGYQVGDSLPVCDAPAFGASLEEEHERNIHDSSGAMSCASFELQIFESPVPSCLAAATLVLRLLVLSIDRGSCISQPRCCCLLLIRSKEIHPSFLSCARRLIYHLLDKRFCPLGFPASQDVPIETFIKMSLLVLLDNRRSAKPMCSLATLFAGTYACIVPSSKRGTPPTSQSRIVNPGLFDSAGRGTRGFMHFRNLLCNLRFYFHSQTVMLTGSIGPASRWWKKQSL